jgi:RNA polymerase sigma factor (sigma-70 family)
VRTDSLVSVISVLKGAYMHEDVVQATALMALNTSESLQEAIGLLRRAVYGFSLGICHRREDAEDATQEVLFRSLKYLGKFQDPHALAVWLYVVARNQLRRTRRKSIPYLAKTVSLDGFTSSLSKTVCLCGDMRKSPENLLIRVEEGRLLRRAILRIPGPLRSVLVLHDLKEFTTPEIAKILALRQGTVRVRLCRARIRLRNEIDAILAGRNVGNPNHSSV